MSLFLGGQQVDVVGNEELPRSHNSCSPVGDKFPRSVVGLPFRLLKLKADMTMLNQASVDESRI